jgi:cholera toxin transcriptional activator
MTGDAVRRVFRFGVFEADSAAEELRKHGLRLKLHSQAFRVLVMLLERPAEVVTRDEMRARLWGTDTFVDFDHGLNSAINKIRTALNDSAAEPRYVETVPGKGYRFITPVTIENLSPPLAPPPVPVVPQPAAPPRPEAGFLLSKPDELPTAPPKMVSALIVLVQVLYLSIYLTALANLREASEVLLEIGLLAPHVSTTVLIAMAAPLIPVRLYIVSAASLGLAQLPAKFARMFPVLLVMDLLWALAPFLLIHHVSMGLALGMSAALVCLPFAQRSLMLMYRSAG